MAEKVIFKNIGNNLAVRSGKKEVNGVITDDVIPVGSPLAAVRIQDVLQLGHIVIQGEQDYQQQMQLPGTALRKKAAECRMRIDCTENETGKKTVLYIGLNTWAAELVDIAGDIEDEVALNQGKVTFTGDIKTLKYFEWAIDTHGGAAISDILVIAHHDGTPKKPMEKFHYNHLWQRVPMPGDVMHFKHPENSDTKEKKFPFTGSTVTFDGNTLLRIEVNKGEDIEFIFNSEIIQRANL